MTCNHCGARMAPTDEALVPAMVCHGCGRMVPRGAPGVRLKGSERREMNRVARAARRQKLAREAR